MCVRLYSKSSVHSCKLACASRCAAAVSMDYSPHLVYVHAFYTLSYESASCGFICRYSLTLASFMGSNMKVKHSGPAALSCRIPSNKHTELKASSPRPKQTGHDQKKKLVTNSCAILRHFPLRAITNRQAPKRNTIETPGIYIYICICIYVDIQIPKIEMHMSMYIYVCV